MPVEPLDVPKRLIMNMNQEGTTKLETPDPRPEPMPDLSGVGNGFLDIPFSAGTDIGNRITNRLTGMNGEERYQLWPEKVVRSALTALPDAAAGKLPVFLTDPATGEQVANPEAVARTLDMASLGGAGGLATGATDATLGSAPFLRPALKYEGKIYKAPPGGEHLDALPAHLADEFQRQAMSGEDISNFNFGFMNHKGQFLSREAALDYGIKEGLIDPHAGKYGTLTSTLLADSSKPGTAIEAMAKTQPFYSAVEHQVNAIPQAKMTGEQWLGTLGNKPGVKPEEMQWTGLQDFLKEKGKEPVTKAEVQEHLANNKVELKDVVKGTPTINKASPYYNKEVERVLRESSGEAEDNIHMQLSNDAKAYQKLMKDHPELKNDDDWADTVMNSVFGSRIHNDTKYGSYQLPGGENYREMLLTLPEKGKRYWNDGSPVTAEDLADPFTAAAADRVAHYGDREAMPYKSSHWDEPNILAHIRMNDRMIEGKKSLHLEEIQSDWHQQGRDRGYTATDPKKFEELNKQLKEAEEELSNHKQKIAEAHLGMSWQKFRNENKDPYVRNQTLEELNQVSQTDPTYINLFRKTEALREATNEANPINKVPDAPFKKTWYELALKRMIREAAEKGYDRLSWTPGEAQAARYDLSKQIDTLKYNPDTHHLVGFKNGTKVLSHLNVEPKDLPDFVGKEIASKIDKAEVKDKLIGGSYKVLNDIDLKIGGEGMKGFYDQIIPKALEKISGEKVKTTTLDARRRDAMGRLATEQKEGDKEQTIHYIDIPQSLKDKAMYKGFPLFSGGFMFTPVQGDPFASNQK
jgi:hypothetical protein